MIGIELLELANGVSALEEHAEDEELNEYINNARDFILYVLKEENIIKKDSYPYSYADDILCHLLKGRLKTVDK